MFEWNHPALAMRNCQHCLKFVYNEKTGEVLKTAGGREQERDAKSPPPCRRRINVEDGTTGCPKGSPEKPNTLSKQNLIALEFYRRKLILGRVPDDPLSEEIASLIYRCDRMMERKQEREATDAVMTQAMIRMSIMRIG